MHLCVEEYVANDPAKNILQRPLFGMHRTIWPDDTSVEFHLPHGKWIELLRDSGFEISASSRFRPRQTPYRVRNSLS